MNANQKVICETRRCGWHGLEHEALVAKSPFSDDDLVACPECKEVGTLVVACDEPGCWKEASCGTPIPGGYRRTCFDHRPKELGET